MLKYIKEVIYMNELVLKILDYIDNNLYKKITMDELSRVFFFNKDYIMRTFKKELRMTIIDYINRKRIYNSLEELKTTDDMMLKVALKHGYVSQEYFSEIFSKYMGVNPLTYRKFRQDISWGKTGGRSFCLANARQKLRPPVFITLLHILTVQRQEF